MPEINGGLLYDKPHLLIEFILKYENLSDIFLKDWKPDIQRFSLLLQSDGWGAQEPVYVCFL